jgi:hypothetical protein
LFALPLELEVLIHQAANLLLQLLHVRLLHPSTPNHQQPITSGNTCSNYCYTTVVSNHFRHQLLKKSKRSQYLRARTVEHYYRL